MEQHLCKIAKKVTYQVFLWLLHKHLGTFQLNMLQPKSLLMFLQELSLLNPG